MPDFPMAVGVAHPCIESLAIGRRRRPFAAAWILPRRRPFPRSPRQLPAPCQDRDHNPKTVLREHREACEQGKLGGREKDRIAAAMNDISLLRKRCPLGLRALRRRSRDNTFAHYSRETMLSGVSTICFAASYAVALALEISRLLFRSGVRRLVMLGFAGAGLVAHTAFLYYRASVRPRRRAAVERTGLVSSWRPGRWWWSTCTSPFSTPRCRSGCSCCRWPWG